MDGQAKRIADLEKGLHLCATVLHDYVMKYGDLGGDIAYEVARELLNLSAREQIAAYVKENSNPR